MLMREPSDGELAQTLTNLIDAFRKGDLAFCPTGTGFDEQTVAAVNRFATSEKTPTDEVILRTEFARMLDGTHLAEYHAEEEEAWTKLLGG